MVVRDVAMLEAKGGRIQKRAQPRDLERNSIVGVHVVDSDNARASGEQTLCEGWKPMKPAAPVTMRSEHPAGSDPVIPVRPNSISYHPIPT